MKPRYLYLSYLIAPFLFAACGSHQGTTNTQTTAPAALESGQGAPQAILPKLHAIDQAEIQASQMALTKACSADVKQYAQTLVADHTKADQQVLQQAGQSSVDVNNVQFSSDEQRMMTEQANDFNRLN